LQLAHRSIGRGITEQLISILDGVKVCVVTDRADTQLPLESVRDLLGIVRALYSESVRDLLGIVRALYSAWQERGIGPIEMEELRSIGEDLRDALRMAAGSKPCSRAMRAAWAKAERATLRLGDIMNEHDNLKQLVAHQSERIGFRDLPRSEPEGGRLQRAR
jgi:hypothetical protein